MIRAQNIHKYYDSKRALGPISFEIADGETVGFLGLNGAGKTTALRILACDLRPSAGSVVVGDIDAITNSHEVRKRIGYLPENPPLYVDMTVENYLSYAGRLRQMSKVEVTERLPEVLELTDLKEVRSEIISTLSHGYRQRVGVAQSIVHQPMLIILDEPTRGLDPVQTVEMRKMIQNLKNHHTVLVSSHILTEISATCDRLLVLGDGEIIGMGTESDLAKQMVGSSQIIVAVRSDDQTSDDELVQVLEGINNVSGVEIRGREDGCTVFQLVGEEDVRAQVCRTLVEAGRDVLQLVRDEQELESVFIKLVKGERPDHANH